MSTLNNVRLTFTKSFKLMRFIVTGTQNVRVCHNDSKDNGNNIDKDGHGQSQSENDESTSNQNSSDTYSDEGLDDSMIHDRILSAALQFVPKYGWTEEAIAEGARIEGLSAMATGLFPRQGGDLVLHFINKCNIDLGHYLAENSRTEEENRKIIDQSEFIRKAIEVRLRMMIPYVDSWPQAMGLLAYPSNAVDAIQSVANMTDDIWYHSNDTSTDLNWYTKRASLATIYGATELYMLQDKSDEFENTWSFLDRRFANIRNTGNFLQSLSQAREDTFTLSCAAFNLARNISGFNRWNR